MRARQRLQSPHWADEDGILEQSQITLVSLTDTSLQDRDATLTDDAGSGAEEHADAVTGAPGGQECALGSSLLIPPPFLHLFQESGSWSPAQPHKGPNLPGKTTLALLSGRPQERYFLSSLQRPAWRWPGAVAGGSGRFSSRGRPRGWKSSKAGGPRGRVKRAAESSSRSRAATLRPTAGPESPSGPKQLSALGDAPPPRPRLQVSVRPLCSLQVSPH